MKDENIELNKFYFTTIEGEDENGNTIYGEKIKLGEVETANIEIE